VAHLSVFLFVEPITFLNLNGFGSFLYVLILGTDTVSMWWYLGERVSIWWDLFIFADGRFSQSVCFL